MIPQSFINKYKSKIKGSRIFGMPIETLSREELMASLVCMGERCTESLENNIKSMKFLREAGKR